jgi:hypothetical protein
MRRPADHLCKLGMLVPERLDSSTAPVLEERGSVIADNIVNLGRITEKRAK